MNYINIKNGKRVGTLPLKDGTYKLIKPNRSLQQNNYYWLLIECIVKEYREYGYIHTSGELHKLFKKGLLPRVRVYSENKKNYVYQRQSTAKLKTKGFKEYIDSIKLLCEHGALHKIPDLEEIGAFILPEAE